MTTELPETYEFKDHVRRRPAMYLGNEMVLGLIKGLVIDCMALCNTDDIRFEIILSSKDRFTFKVSSHKDLSPFVNSFLDTETGFAHDRPRVLTAISKDLNITDGPILTICFSLDETVIKDRNVDYIDLTDELVQIAILYRNVEIICIDKRQQFVNRNYYHFPEGILYLFDKVAAKVLGRPKFRVIYDGCVNSREYQLCIGYRTDWYPDPMVASFANEREASPQGILVEGIGRGLVAATKKYAKETGAENMKINRRKFLNGLIIVCSVKGDNISFDGNFNDESESKTVKKEIASIVSKLVLDYFRANADVATQFLLRFDTTNPVSVMY